MDGNSGQDAPYLSPTDPHVVLVRTPTTNVKPDEQRFKELGTRGLTIRSGHAKHGAKGGKPITLSMQELNNLQRRSGAWLGGVENLTEEAMQSTGTNNASRGNGRGGVVVRQGGRPVPPVAAAAPVVRPAPVAVAPRRPVSTSPQDLEFETMAAQVPDPHRDAEAGGFTPEPLQATESSRMNQLEAMMEELLNNRDMIQNTPVGPDDSFPWANSDGTVRPPEYVLRFKVGGFATEARFHYVEIRDEFLVLSMDSRDTASPRSYPSTIGATMEVEVPTEGGATALLVNHVGLQFTIGVLDIMVLPFAPPPDDSGDNDDEQPNQS